MPKKAVANCPYDTCPMTPFAKVKATHGFTIALHGCRYCNFNLVIAVASDANGKERRVAQWHPSSELQLYILDREYGHNPSWFALACSALPTHKQPEHLDHNEPKESK